jgi:capsular polysaccharide biosynthesis protein
MENRAYELYLDTNITCHKVSKNLLDKFVINTEKEAQVIDVRLDGNIKISAKDIENTFLYTLGMS